MIDQNFSFHIFVPRNKAINNKKYLISNLRTCHLLNFEKNINDKYVWGYRFKKRTGR